MGHFYEEKEMANIDRTGFHVVANRFGSPYNGAVHKCFSTGDNLFKGDLVKWASDPVTSDEGVYLEVDRMTATTELCVGVVVGWDANPDALGNLYHAASGTNAVHIVYIQDVMLEAQDDAASMVATDVGFNIDATFTAGSTTTGQSGMELSGTSAATTAGLQFKIVQKAAKADNTIAIANCGFYVTINQSGWIDQTAGV